MSVDQVVAGQIHRGVVHRVDEVGLHHGVVGVIHGVGCVDHIHLTEIKRGQTMRPVIANSASRAWFRCDDSAGPQGRSDPPVDASLPGDVTDSYLDLEVVADVAAVELGADQLELPVEQSLRVPVLVADQMQDLLVVGHGVDACSNTESVIRNPQTEAGED